MPNRPDIRDVEVIAPNFKRRLSGVTSTIIQLVPVQNKLGQKVATLGPGLPDTLPKLRWRDLLSLWTPPPGKQARIWHARRNLEMLPGVVMRDLLRMKLKLVFTSASQRRHTGWTKFLISRMDAVIATSEKTASYLDVPCTVIMHGIDTERFSPPADKLTAKATLGLDPAQKYAGCFGRIRHQKGTDLFVEAMIALLPERPDWSAIVAGRATAQHVEFENNLKEKVRAAGLENRILFVGEHTNINEWYRALDLFIAPQRWEGFGLTPLEAMASGVPVVATDVGAFSEIIPTAADMETGVVIPTDNVETMATTAAFFMDSEVRRAKAGSDAQHHAGKRFTITEEARALGQVYCQRIDADAPLDILIVGKDSKFGLTKDIELLVDAMAVLTPDKRVGTSGIRDRGLFERLVKRKRARLVIHIERIFPRWFSAASRHMVIPNQERFPFRHLGRLKKIDLVLAKSRHAEKIFGDLGAPTVYLGFTSEDRFDSSIPRDWSRFLHVAGGSTLKGTEDVLALWEKHPEWPELVLVQKEHLAPKTVPANVRLLSGYLDDHELRTLQNGIGIHLCPSRAEGWGHHLVESMSVGALIVATNAPPMNEHITPQNGLPVDFDRTEPRHLGTSFFVSPSALEKAIEAAIIMPEGEKQRLGLAARQNYEEIVTGFMERLQRLLSQENT